MSIVVHIEVTLDAGYDELSDGELVNLALTHAGVDGFAVSYMVERSQANVVNNRTSD